jgi:hypothetical protein
MVLARGRDVHRSTVGLPCNTHSHDPFNDTALSTEQEGVRVSLNCEST